MEKAFSEAEQEVIRQAKKKALRLLEFSDRTEKQLRDKLEDQKFPLYAVDAAIGYVKSFHYLDDIRFAENYIRSRQDRKSRNELMNALRETGVSTSDAETAAASFEWDETSVVRTLFLKKYAQKDLNDPKIYEKAFRYFSGKGFSYQDIRNGIASALEGSEGPEAP